jgi:hypothetical protein
VTSDFRDNNHAHHVLDDTNVLDASNVFDVCGVHHIRDVCNIYGVLKGTVSSDFLVFFCYL